MSTLQDLNKALSRKQAILDENAAGVEQQKKSGKQTARERIAMLLDGGSSSSRACSRRMPASWLEAARWTAARCMSLRRILP